jgi:membrane protein implicated in regulation of membrane protease activity
MAIELRSHLQDAISEGKVAESVVGDDLEAFAEDWAAAYRGAAPVAPKAAPARPELPKHESDPGGGVGLWLGLGGIVLLVIVAAIFAPEDETLDQGMWTAVWLVAAAALAIGEMVTAGFFLLPFAVAAGAAGILAIVGASIPSQIITFVVVSVLVLWLLQRFARKDIHGDLLPVGAARYMGASAVVTEDVNRVHGTGMVKMGTEVWRATTDSNDDIGIGVEVRVVEVRGARLVVEPVE